MTLIQNLKRGALPAGIVAGAAAALLALSACSNVQDQLLEPQNPDLIDPSAVGNPSAASALRIGALGAFKGATGAGESLWRWSGLLSDEWKSSDTFSQRNETDDRSIQTNNATWAGSYSTAQQTRGYIYDAIEKMKQFNPQEKVQIGELYMSLAFMEMQLGEDLCNGIPLGLARNGVVDYSDPSYKPLTNQEVFAKALTHADSAVALAVGDSAVAVAVRNASLVTKARLLVDMGQQAQAAALVPVATVPTAFQYTQSFSVATTDNGNWSFNNSQGRYTVSDSAQVVNGQQSVIKNALPFVSANDPRVPTKAGTAFSPAIKPFDTSTPMFVQQIWSGRSDPIPVVSGLDARLIEAEGKLKANDIAGMMTILNALRAAPPAIGSFKPAAMPALATPATQDAATSLYFREKAFWTFGRGQRLGDLRRLIRQYGRTQDNVFPTGNFHKGGIQYLNDVNLPVTDTDKTNPQFKGCIDRNA